MVLTLYLFRQEERYITMRKSIFAALSLVLLAAECRSASLGKSNNNSISSNSFSNNQDEPTEAESGRIDGAAPVAQNTVDIGSSLTEDTDTNLLLSTISNAAYNNANNLVRAQKNTTYGTTTKSTTGTSINERKDRRRRKEKESHSSNITYQDELSEAESVPIDGAATLAQDTIDIGSSLTIDTNTNQLHSTISEATDNNANNLARAQKNTTYGTTTNSTTGTSIEEREGEGRGKEKEINSSNITYQDELRESVLEKDYDDNDFKSDDDGLEWWAWILIVIVVIVVFIFCGATAAYKVFCCLIGGECDDE